MKKAMQVLDALFGPLRAWRKFRGGTWVRVDNPAAMIWDAWVRPPVGKMERETAREVWA